jgi:hypothetical protein
MIDLLMVACTAYVAVDLLVSATIFTINTTQSN